MALNFLNNGYFAGKVGIGTASPLSKLHIDSTQDAVHFTRTGQETYRILHGTSGLYFTRPNSSALKFGVTQNSDFDIYDTAGIVMFRADSSNGNVGIGTTAPTHKLVVNSGNTNVTSVFKSADNQAWISVQDDDSGTFGALIGIDSDESENFTNVDKCFS